MVKYVYDYNDYVYTYTIEGDGMKIAVANSKGGVGKSTIANILAQNLDLPLKNIDPFQDPFVFTDVKEYKRGESYIADMGGFAGKDMEKELIKTDLVIVPLNPAPRDVVATASFLEWLLSFYTGRVLIVANRSDDKQAQEVKEAMLEVLSDIEAKAEDIRFTSLPQLKSLQSWELAKKRWTDYLNNWNPSYRRAAKKVENFCNDIKEWLETEIQ